MGLMASMQQGIFFSLFFIFSLFYTLKRPHLNNLQYIRFQDFVIQSFKNWIDTNYSWKDKIE